MHLLLIFLGGLLSSLSPVQALPAALNTTDLDALEPSIEERQDPGILAFKFVGWEGCNTNDNPAGSSVVETAWDSLADIANAVNGNVNFAGDAEGDYLGSKTKNTDYQITIQKILENTSTWDRTGGLFSWSIHARCDDWKRGTIQDPLQDCPKGTAKADWYTKCQSRCWAYKKDNNGNPLLDSNGNVQWVARAAAYTTSNAHNTSPVATINFCPSFFTAPTCQAQIDKYGNSPLEHEQLDLGNYQCQGYIMIHELFHIDANIRDHPNADVTHVYDRRIKLSNPGSQPVVRMAYSPEYTKVLANWAGNKVGYWVATNADNLAQYALAKWVTSKIGAYPRYPIVSEAPDGAPYAVTEINGVIGISTNATGIANDDHIDASDVDTWQEADQWSCSDASSDTACIDDTTNPVIALVADDTTPPDSTTTAAPAPPAPSPPAPSISCIGAVKASPPMYIAQADLAANIKDFCSQAAKQGVQDSNTAHLQRIFNLNTPEQIAITMDWPSGLDFTLSEADCNTYMNNISDDCDGNDPTNNPMNWKGGGTNQVGQVLYQIAPMTIRNTLPKAVGGAIQCSGLKFWLNGNGWANLDSGDCLKANFNGCLGSSYGFNYGNGDDGREWTMTGWIGPGQGNCAHDAIVTCGGPSIYCS